MNKLNTLVAMQLKDKLDYTTLRNKKDFFRTLFFTLCKFGIIVVGVYLILYISQFVHIFFYSETPQIINLVLTLCLVLSIITCSFELMKNLFFSKDNIVLVTFPVEANKIFVSKIIVFYIYELKKSLSFFVPITLGCLILLVQRGLCSPIVFLWIWFPLLGIIAIPVLIGALLSILLMLIYRFIKSRTVYQIILLLIIIILLITGVIYLINLIPESINLSQLWPEIRNFITNVLLSFEKKLVITRALVYILIGTIGADMKYHLGLYTVIGILVLIGIIILLYILNYYVSRPIFFKMMSKNFEINKKTNVRKENKKRNKYFTLINKEFIINLRTIEISVNYLAIYIIVPMLVLLLNRIYKAIDANEFGIILIYTFNILLICLPMLASNSLVATYYSREGRAGYMKKTKPIYAAYPLFAKVFFNIVFSIPSIFFSVGIFGSEMNLSLINIIALGFGILFIHFAHMFSSAKLDIMNPQNEQYATTGVTIDNPNENKATILAFIYSVLYALVSYKLLEESITYTGDFNKGSIKLLIIGIVILVLACTMFLKRIKAFYYEIQG